MLKRRNTLVTYGAMAAVNPFIRFNSSSRLAMLSHHLAQAVTPKKSDIPRILTGLETQLEAFNVTMPTDGIVISVHQKFKKTLDEYQIKENPSITIIYQCQITGKYDCLDINTYDTRHRTYGNRMVLNPIVKQLRAGSHIAKDTILAKSPNVKDGGIYSNGLSCNVVNLSVPASIEDGYGASESFCERASLLELPSVVGEWGKKMYPKNTYGDENHFKPYPEVGDKIREDGLVFAFAEYDDAFDAIEMSNKALMEIDMVHDIRIYGVPGATVYDIIVESGIGETKAKPLTPPAMAVQPERYIAHASEYYAGIVNIYESLVRSDKNLNISPRLTQLITRAIADKPNLTKYKVPQGGIIRRTRKRIPLDEYRVEIFCYREQPISLGSKMTGNCGNKGVICYIFKDEDMPVDAYGNRADLIKFSKSTVSRMNYGQLYEGFIGGVSRDLTTWIRNNYQSLPFDTVFGKLMEFYEVASPLTFNTINSNYRTFEQRKVHLDTVIQDGIYLYIPVDSEHVDIGILNRILKVFKPCYGPVSYRDLAGNMVTTKDNVFIGVEQIIILEKTDQHPMSVSSGKLQHHGVLAGPNKISRWGSPSKVQAVKVFSETEVRMYGAYMGGEIIAELLTMSNSPESHKNVVANLLASRTPSRLEPIMDMKMGTSRPLMFINHVLFSFGLEIKNA